jgi:hypothetical protein
MLQHQAPSSANPIVKLFPRLAPAVVATKVRNERKRPRDGIATSSNPSRCQDERAKLRARLLRMILDNEQSRRQDHRPNAS